MQKVNFALIGAGSIAGAYVQAFKNSARAQLVAVVDTNLEAASTLADLLGCRVFDTHTSMLRAGNFDAALICTPPSTHATIALDLMRNGIHILCEKPFSTDVASARRMVHVAGRSGVKLTMGSRFRYVGDVIQAQAFIAGGLLGEVLTFENTFTSRISMAGSWQANPILSGGGVIIHSGTHSVDMLRYLCGPVNAIAAYEGTKTQLLPVEDTAHIVARTIPGVLGCIDLSWSCNKEADSYIQVCGTDGALALGWGRSKYRHGPNGNWISFGSGYNKLDALCAQLDNFCAAVRNQEPLLITSEDALASVETIAAAYASLRCDRWIPVDSAGGAPAPAVAGLTAAAAGS